MTDHRDTEHLTPEGIQAFLDGELPPEAAAAVRGHRDACARCRAEMEAWELLFSELEELPRLEPSPGLAGRVMTGVRVPVPLGVRARQWAGAAVDRLRRGAGHLAPGRLQDHLEGLLGSRQSAGVEAHLAACSRCRTEASGWRRLFEGLGALPRFAPSEGFAERVMAAVELRTQVARAAAVSRSARARDWVGGLWPSTVRGWAVAMGMAAAPTAGAAVLAVWLFSHPLLTPAHLLAFLWWKGSEAAGAAAAWALDGLRQGAEALGGQAAAELFANSPLVLASAALGFSMLTVAAVWVLYRNLFTTPSVNGRYAHLS